MAQADGIVSNASGAAVRADLNNQLAAVFTNHSGPTEPSTTYAYQWWADTTNGVMKLRNAANSAWITMFQLDGEWTSLALENGSAASPSIYFKDSGTDTGVYSPGADQVGISTGGVQRVNFNAALEVVFNDGGNDIDFRIEGDTEENLFKIDAGTDQVQVKNLNGGPLAGTRNRIINGDMRIDQRNSGVSVTPTANGTYTLDRWLCILTQASKYSVQRNAGSVTPPAGFTNYLGVTSTSAYSVVSSDLFWVDQRIEGFNTADLAWGTANAKTVTLSFWVRSSLTGTFGGTISNDKVSGRSYPYTYTISSANTWEYKTIQIAGDTTGTWAADNTSGMLVAFGLGAGSANTGTPNAWTASTVLPTGSTSVIGTNGATFYITGVQLEPGTVATPFERRSYGQELALCQRYFQTIGNGSSGFAASSSIVEFTEKFLVEMRAAPSISWRTGATARWRIYGSGDVNNGNSSSLANTSTTPTGLWSQQTGFAGISVGAVATSRNSANDPFINISAEL